MAKRIFILGGGRFGVHLAARLCEFGSEVVIGDDNTERVKDLADEGYNAIEMDANDEVALKDSGALSADVVVVAIGENMEASILATLLLKQHQARHVIARALDTKHAQVLERLGADEVILPVRDMAYRVAEKLRDGSKGERYPIAGDYLMAEVELGRELHGRTLAEARLLEDYNVTAVLLKQSDDGRAVLRQTSGATRLSAGDILMVVGSREKLRKFERDCGHAGD